MTSRMGRYLKGTTRRNLPKNDGRRQGCERPEPRNNEKSAQCKQQQGRWFRDGQLVELTPVGTERLKEELLDSGVALCIRRHILRQKSRRGLD